MRTLLAACLLLPLLAGCERAMQDMYRQPRYQPGQGSVLFADGRADRPPPPGAAAVDAPTEESPPLTQVLLQRGQERYSIYCLPCHSALGDGDGMVVRRGFPRPPSFHEQRLRDAPDRHFFDVMTQGYGAMYSYADRLTPQDRWAVVAYVRALQLSQQAPLAELPPALRARLAAPEPTR